MLNFARNFTSSAVKNLAFDAEQGRAEVEFTNGSKYGYIGVSKDAIKSLINTSELPSIGQWVNQNVLGYDSNTGYTKLA